MAEMKKDSKDPEQIYKLLKQLLDDGRVSPEEFEVLEDALRRYHTETCDAMIDVT